MRVHACMYLECMHTTYATGQGLLITVRHNKGYRMISEKFYRWVALALILIGPLAAAIPFAWGVYEEVKAFVSLAGFAVAAGIATAVTLEAVGMLGGHLAITLWRLNPGRKGWILPALAVIVYTGLGILTIGYYLGQWVGAIAFGLMPIGYFLVALQLGTEVEQAEAKAARVDLTAERREERAKAERREERREERAHELALEKLRLDYGTRASIVPAQAAAQASIASYACDTCDRSFDTQQAVNAHKRFCAGTKAAQAAVSANGTGGH